MKMLTKKKKIIVLVSMLVLLVVTGFLNIVLNSTTEEASKNLGDDYSSATFFSTYRTDRTNTRNEMIGFYQEIVENSSNSTETKNSAQEMILNLLEASNIEVTMEGFIKAKGFSDVIVSYSSTYINIIVQSAELTQTEVAQIVEIIQSQTDNRDIDFIKIIPIE